MKHKGIILTAIFKLVTLLGKSMGILVFLSSFGAKFYGLDVLPGTITLGFSFPAVDTIES